MSGVRVAIVHERFTELGGSEKVVEELVAMWPEAVVHTSVVDRSVLPPGLATADVRPSALQRLYRGGHDYRALLPLLPGAMALIDVGQPDVVIVSHHAFANRVRPAPGVPVVAYVHSPARWLWERHMLDGEVGGRVGRLALRAFAGTQRRADQRAAARLSAIVANSRHVAARVRRYWGREAIVVHPPVDVAWFTPDPAVRREDFFLLAGRLVAYKQPEVAVDAAIRADVPLVVAGEGRGRPALEAAARSAGGRVTLLGRVDDVTLRDLYRRCRALVFPGEEDFGLVPVEAMACGTPVVGRAVGGLLDSVVDGVTGMLYEGQGPGPLADAMLALERGEFETEIIRRQAERFGPSAFRARMAELVESVAGASVAWGDGAVRDDPRRLVPTSTVTSSPHRNAPAWP